MSAPLLLDVSNNNTIGPLLLKRSGAAGLYCKATEGVGFVDRTYPAHRAVARKVGVPFGGYLFLHSNAIGDEAAFFLEHARPAPGDLEPVVDAETGATGPEAGRALSCLRALADRGYRPLLYGSASYLLAMLLERPELREFRMWEADYAPRREPVQHHASVVMWQFSQSYRVLWRRFDASRVFVPIGDLLIR